MINSLSLCANNLFNRPMAGENSTGSCPGDLVASFEKSMEGKMWRVNALLLASAILAGLIVGIGAYGQRYRHHRFTRFVFLGATTLFLPIISTVVTMHYSIMDMDLFNQLTVKCEGTSVILWAFLFQIIMINTSVVVAVDDREGRNIGPPFELLVQGVWTFYLAISYEFGFNLNFVLYEFVSFALICAKMVLKYYAFIKARESFALGRNPRLIFGYMQQLLPQEASQHDEPSVSEDAPPPSLLVMGEERRDVYKQPHGYVFKDDSGHKNYGLVTIDRVWMLDSNMLPMSTPQQIKDLCLSFALFKLLRCRFARYKVTNNAASKDTFSFFWSLLLKDGGHDSVFGVIADELSFVHDYYYSSLPISYSKCWLPIVGIFISLFSIGYCIIAAVFLTILVAQYLHIDSSQIWCEVICIKNHRVQRVSDPGYIYFGSWYFDLVPIFLLFMLVVISEKWVVFLLHRRCKLMNHWDEKMGQCSVLVLRPRTTSLSLLWHLLHLPDQKRKVKVTAAVKVCIIRAIRSSRNGSLSSGRASLLRWSQVDERFLWACDSKSASGTILTWHIATSILEVRHPCQRNQEQGSPLISSENRIATSHLSRYCAYLVTWCPELLPDNDEWSKDLYEEVKKDAELAIAGHAAVGSSTPEAKYQHLVELLSVDSRHEILKNGARLGKQLVELTEGEDTAWNLLADFWSQMILYVAPSDNLKGHSEAIARGGELITLLWALLFHAGIVSRTSDTAGAATAADVV
ncbi:uncharacterized protein LOC133889939 [Phragmites australis]|uniref:uncharacterized protein LOC133889939 n=1 Tax=Phragmites australis TaxID=29695 RepID=UPI002D7847BE|nr:uncharacterized protein LOC133889939 [Phragmites australis]